MINSLKLEMMRVQRRRRHWSVVRWHWESVSFALVLLLSRGIDPAGVQYLANRRQAAAAAGGVKAQGLQIGLCHVKTCRMILICFMVYNTVGPFFKFLVSVPFVAGVIFHQQLCH